MYDYDFKISVKGMTPLEGDITLHDKIPEKKHSEASVFEDVTRSFYQKILQFGPIL